MGTVLQYDTQASERLVAIYMTPDVVAQRRQILHSLNLRSGERVLDVGVGPGFLASAMAEVVGPSGSICGVDISEPLLSVAKTQCAHQPWVELLRGDASQLPFPDESFDMVVSTQVLEYVRDLNAALTEIFRVLRPGGRTAVLDTDWDSIVWHATDQERMRRILAAWDEHATDPYLPRTLAGRLRAAGFCLESQQIIPLFNPTFGTNSYSNRVIDSIVKFVSDRNGIPREDAEAWAEELRHMGERGTYFFSLNRYLFIARKPEPRCGGGVESEPA